jgi:hypothetical protein
MKYFEKGGFLILSTEKMKIVYKLDKIFLLSLSIYFTSTLLIIWRLLLPGYIFTLDMGFPPDIDPLKVLSGLENGVISSVTGIFTISLVNLLKTIIPFWIIQKAILFASFFLCGVSAHRLCPTKSAAGKFFAGTLYMLNPFTFVRYINGHWLILLGYAIIPFAVKQFMNFFESSNKKTESLKTIIILSVIGAISAHVFVMTSFILLVFYILYLLQKERKSNFAKVTFFVLFILATTLIVNSYWITLNFLTVNATEKISYQDLLVFRSREWGTGSNLIFTLASMHGFWRPPEGYHYVSEILPFWQVLFIFILLLAIYGLIVFFNDKQIGVYVQGLLFSAIISMILALGVANQYTTVVFEFLFNNIFFFRGFREPQKFVALIVLAYSFLGGLAVGTISNYLKKHLRKFFGSIIIMFLLVIPFLYSINMLAGIGGQPSLGWFPEEWYETNNFLINKTGDFIVLFFPWHAYMLFSWSERVIVNPAPSFFQKPIIQGKNIEVEDIETQSIEPFQNYIRFLLEHKYKIHNLGCLLSLINVRYIILAKEVDYLSYDFLYEQEDLKLVLNNSKMAVFENLYETSKIFWVKEIEQFSSWEELIHSYEKQAVQFEPIKCSQVSIVEYEIDVPFDNGFVIFTESYDEGWAISNQKASPFLGIINVFVSEQPGIYKVYYQKYIVLLASFMLSALTFILCVVYLLKLKMKSG